MGSLKGVKRRYADEEVVDGGDGDDGNNRMTGGGSGSREGYGKMMMPMTIHNIFNKGQLKYPFTLKRQEYLSLNFTEDTSPIVLPYQLMDFWLPVDTLQNRANFDGLVNISLGVQYHSAEIEIEVYGVTRERLLEGGSTNYKTYDFETSQNLFVTTMDRSGETFEYKGTDKAAGRMPFDKCRWFGSPFNADTDIYTREEIPQRIKKIIKIPIQSLNHNYMWRPELSQYWYKQIPVKTGTKNQFKTTALLLPGPTNMKMPPTGGDVTENWGINELINNEDAPIADAARDWDQQTFWGRSTYPLIVLNQPSITDETGLMKWIYEVRISTKLHCSFIIKPDYYGNLTNDYLFRQLIHHPRYARTYDTQTADYVTIPCVPYEIQV